MNDLEFWNNEEGESVLEKSGQFGSPFCGISDCCLKKCCKKFKKKGKKMCKSCPKR